MRCITLCQSTSCINKKSLPPIDIRIYVRYIVGMVKTIVLKRIINGRIHKSIIRREAIMHMDIIDAIIARCIELDVYVDVDTLIDDVVDRY